MEKRKLTKADIDKVRGIEGFPIAKDEDIIALSDAPYYTACPNPFIADFIAENGTPYDEATDDYHREPFAADVSEGKNDPIYNAHSYHTKVPHKAIMRYILHYTKPGDIVFDGFCGTGMTGVAAQMCGNPDSDFKMKIESEMPEVEWGARKAILSDLSPAATFIAYNYNTPVDVAAFQQEAERILAEVEKECGWMYETRHVVDGKPLMGFDGKPQMGRINYTVWSDVFICPTCSEEMIFWNVAVDKANGKVRDKFTCPHCSTELTKRDSSHAQKTHFDSKLNENVKTTKQVPVLINYSVGRKRFEKAPDEYDIALIEQIDALEIPYWYPIDRMCEGSESRRNDRFGITHVHQFFTKSSLAELALYWNKAHAIDDDRMSLLTKFVHTAANNTISKMRRFRADKKGGGPLSGTLYISSLITPPNPLLTITRNAGFIADAFRAQKLNSRGAVITTNSLSSCATVPDNCIDYIFTDPPFGGNLNYSELSFLWEAWLKVVTNPKGEAVMNSVQGKGLSEYQTLMAQCFAEYYRVLKPGRWMTVEFHNSQNSVWNAIQEALQRSGFIIADVRTLDKQQSSFKQVTTTSAVKQDLVISAYKPKDSFKREFTANAGSEETAWAFVRQHLENLPVAVVKDNHVEVLSERQAFLLFDRMVAYHIMNGISVPLDSTDFYKGLDEKFLKRDGMYFLCDQVNEYDDARVLNDVEPIQFSLMVTNEKSAIAWLYQQLGMKPQTYAELQPQFMQECKTVDKFEAIPELAVMLEDNFLQDDGGRWYVPDVTKAGDVAKLREKKLQKEFEGYLATKGKLKLFRAEAIRVGFAKLWADKNYKLIVETADRLPESIVQEDDKLLMYYDISLGRV